MRPCDQCRRPVENAVRLCEDCQDYNEEHGLEPPSSVSTRTFDPADLKPVPIDRSMSVLVGGFLAVCIALGVLLGLRLGDWSSAFVGGLIGLLFGLAFPRLLRS